VIKDKARYSRFPDGRDRPDFRRGSRPEPLPDLVKPTSTSSPSRSALAAPPSASRDGDGDGAAESGEAGDTEHGGGAPDPSVLGWERLPPTRQARTQQRRAAFRRLGEFLASAPAREQIAPTLVRALLEMGDVAFASLSIDRPGDSTPHEVASCGERPRSAALHATRLRFGDGDVGLLEWSPVDDEGATCTLCLIPWIAREVATLNQPVAEERAPDPRERLRRCGLTPRQLEIALLLIEGKANKEIAARFDCAVSTVEEHLSHVYRKVGVKRRAQLVAVRAREEHSVRPSPSSSSSSSSSAGGTRGV
jgi:DNA-binding CsgD family transcriptional regulator